MSNQPFCLRQLKAGTRPAGRIPEGGDALATTIRDEGEVVNMLITGIILMQVCLEFIAWLLRRWLIIAIWRALRREQIHIMEGEDLAIAQMAQTKLGQVAFAAHLLAGWYRFPAWYIRVYLRLRAQEREKENG